MAVAAQEIPIHRKDVHQWIEDYKGFKNPPWTLEEYVHKQVAKLNLPDGYVDTTSNDSLPAETHVADMICMDLDSYAADY